MKAKTEIIFNAKTVTQDLINWIKEQMKLNGGTKVVIGVSGGKDSSVVAALCVKALGKENVIGLLIPQGEQSDIKYALELVESLGIEHYVINIKDMVDKEIEILENSLNMELTKETKINIPPRIRMTTLYAVAQNIKGCRVVGTDNASERYIGYFTKYGDGGYDFNPIADLVVREVKAIGYELELPQHLIEKVPEDGLSGQTDEERIGITYSVLDEYIRTGKCEDIEMKTKIDKMHKYSQHKIDAIPYFKLI